MPIYTNDPCDDGFFPMEPSLRSSIGIGPKVTKAIDAATRDWLDKHPEATTTVEDNSLTNAKFMDGSVNSRVIEDESITTNDIADLAVTTPKIADSAVTTPKIADSAVTAAKLADNAADGLRTMNTTQPGVAKVGAGLALNNGALELNGGNIEPAVTAWLNAHPEATTTVQDNSVSDSKLVQTGGVLSNVAQVKNELMLPMFFNGWGQGTWEPDHTWTTRNDRVAFRPDIAIEKDSVVRINGAGDEKYAFAAWSVNNGVYTNRLYSPWYTGYCDWSPIEIPVDVCNISIVVAKTDESAISPSSVNTSIAIYNGVEMLGSLKDASHVELTGSEVYERKEVSAEANTYERYTAISPKRARVKKEYLQEIPAGATDCAVVFSSDSMVNGKYKQGFAFYDDNYCQVGGTVIGWISADAYYRFGPDANRQIPSNAKYFMFYWAVVNDDDDVDLDEIDTSSNKVLFNNSSVNYADSLMRQAVSDQVAILKDKFDTEMETTADDTFIISVNHRGYSTEAPENTIPAYILSKKHGFKYAECDVEFTSDGVAVLLHDSTINRTARNADGTTIATTTNIGDITYEEALAYDFGIWKGQEWAGTKIPTFDEFILACKKLSLHPFIELKDVVNGSYWTDTRVDSIASSIKNVGMDGNVSFISFSVSALQKMSAHFPKARLGLGFEGAYSTENFSAYISNAETLLSPDREVIATVSYQSMTDELYSMLTTAGIKPLVWTVNTENVVLALDETVVGVLSDKLNAGEIILNDMLNSI